MLSKIPETDSTCPAMSGGSGFSVTGTLTGKAISSGGHNHQRDLSWLL